MKWDVRLEGGPADGDHAECKGPLPREVFATFCQGCKDWHWFSAPHQGAEVYHHDDDDRDEAWARYVYAGLGGRAARRG